IKGALNSKMLRNPCVNPTIPPAARASYKIKLFVRYHASSQVGGARFSFSHVIVNPAKRQNRAPNHNAVKRKFISLHSQHTPSSKVTRPGTSTIFNRRRHPFSDSRDCSHEEKIGD